MNSISDILIKKKPKAVLTPLYSEIDFVLYQ